MGRRIPLCARCGKKLATGTSVRTEYRGIPGWPEVGWHMRKEGKARDCFDLDPVAKILLRGAPDMAMIVDCLKKIERRGAGRLAANREWKGSASHGNG